METLRKGDKGSLVAMLQLGLIRSGYLSGDADSVFGSATEKAVKRFQTAFGLTPDGVVGPATWNAIERFIKGYFVREIQRGDSVWSLAAMYGTTVAAILTANPDISPENLQIGQNLIIPFGFSVVPDDIPYSYELVTLLIDGLKARYPFIETGTFGKSETGKNLYYIEVGSGKKTLFANAAFHANEWITVPIVMKFTEDYLKAYMRDIPLDGVDVRKLYKNVKFTVAPLINPDGVNLVTGALNSGSYYINAQKIAKDFPSIPFPSGWKANIAGTDLNLQFPANWEKAKEIKYAQGFNKPAPHDFVGYAPVTAPEAKAVYNLTKAQNFNMMLAFHTQGNIIYWKYLDYLPPQSFEIGTALSKASGYPLEITPEMSSYAGYKDWFIQDFNRPGYTVEAGIGVNPLPISQFPSIYSANKPLLLTALEEVSKL